MRGKLLTLGCIGCFGLYIALTPDPLNAVAAFIIAGIVPGTQYMLGPWPMIAFGVVCLYGIWKLVQKLRFRALAHTAKTIRAERLTAEFKAAHSGVPTKNRSVIAAPQPERY